MANYQSAQLTSDMSCHLEINNLHFSYQSKMVLSGLTLQITQPGIVGLLGLNGEGKSTLLKILAGIIPVAGTSIACTEQSLENVNPTGYLPERPLFYPELNVYENIKFAAEIQGIRGQLLHRQIDQAMQHCHIAQNAKQLAGSLSKGFQQRLGLAMAIVHQPGLLLLDEPTDGLDPQQISETHQLIKSLAENTAILISSHRLDEISRLCNRLLILHQGKLQHDADVTDQQRHEDIDQIFKQIISGKAA